MAKAIRHIEKKVPNPLEEQAQAIQDMMESVAQSRDALVLFLDILKEAHEAGLLEMLHGLLKARHEVGYLAIKQMNQPTMHHTIKNAMGALAFLGKMDPEHLQKVLDGVASGLDRMAKQEQADQSTSIWGLAKNFRDPDVHASIQTAMEFARGMGEQLRKGSEQTH